MSLSPSALVGTWNLCSFAVFSADKRAPRHPFGAQAQGRIVYAADGHMMAVLSAPQPTESVPGALEASHHASDAEKAAAYDRYLSYSGRWELDGDQIHHHVDLALAPGVAGQTQTRQVSFEASPAPRLTLSYVRTSRRGIEHRFVLEWKRADSEPSHG